MRGIALLLAVVLAGCGKDAPAPAPAYNPPFSGGISLANWSITQSSMPRPTNYGAFNFQNCASASVCWDSYVEVPLAVSVNGAQSFALNYTITGDAPAWVNDSPGNTCGGPATLRLLLHRQGDMGADPSARWYSGAAIPLALGAQALTVPFVLANWINTSGQSVDALGFSTTMLQLGSVGFVLGGGCFAGHGVAVSSGSAALAVSSASIQ